RAGFVEPRRGLSFQPFERFRDLSLCVQGAPTFATWLPWLADFARSQRLRRIPLRRRNTFRTTRIPAIHPCDIRAAQDDFTHVSVRLRPAREFRIVTRRRV